MKLYGQLIKARLEQLSGVVSSIAKGLIHYNTDSDKPFIDTGTGVGEGIKEIMVRESLGGEASGPYVIANPILAKEGGTGIIDYSTYAEGDVLRLNAAKNGFVVEPAKGGGGLDTWLNEDFEKTNAADFTTGNNISFLGAGTMSGVLSDDTITNISSKRSLKYVAGAASLNDYIASQVIDIDDKQRNNESGLTMYFKYSGSANIEVVFWDVTNNKKINRSLETISSESSATRYSSSYFIPSTCTQIRYGFHFLEPQVAGDVLIFDDIELTSDPFSYSGVLTSQAIHLSGQASVVISDLNSPFGFQQAALNMSGDDILRVNQTGTSTEFIANRDADVSINFIATIPSDGNECYITINGVIVVVGSHSSSIERRSVVTYSGRINTGDIIRFTGSVSIAGGAKDHSMSILATASEEKIIVPVSAPTEDYVWSDVALYQNNISSLGIVAGTAIATSITLSEDCYAIIAFAVRHTTNTNGIGCEIRIDGVVVASGVSANGTITRTWGAGASLNIKLKKGQVITFTAAAQYINPFISVVLNRVDAKFLAAIPNRRIAILKDIKPNGTSGGTGAPVSFITRNLNTISGDDLGIVINTDVVTLRPGRWLIRATSPCRGVDGASLHWKNVTDNQFVVSGSSVRYENNTFLNDGLVTLEGEFTIKTPKDFELQMFMQTQNVVDSLGAPTSATGLSEIYSVVVLERLS